MTNKEQRMISSHLSGLAPFEDGALPYSSCCGGHWRLGSGRETGSRSGLFWGSGAVLGSGVVFRSGSMTGFLSGSLVGAGVTGGSSAMGFGAGVSTDGLATNPVDSKQMGQTAKCASMSSPQTGQGRLFPVPGLVVLGAGDSAGGVTGCVGDFDMLDDATLASDSPQ